MKIKKIIIRPSLYDELGTDLQFYLDKLNEFINNPESHGFNLETLNGVLEDCFSARANGKARMILEPIAREHDEQGVTLVLTQIAENHQYKRVRPLRQEELQHLAQEAGDNVILPRQQQVLPQSIDLEICDRVDFINNQYIAFDEGQQRAQQKGMNALPLIISGAPGSGKTSIVLSLIRQNIDAWSRAYEEGTTPTILILAVSELLVENMNREWLAMYEREFSGREHILPPDCVEFKTPEMIYKEQHPNARLAGELEFIKWYTDYARIQNTKAKAQSKNLKTQKKQDAPAKDDTPMLSSNQAANIYQEFQLMSGYRSFKQYNKALSTQFSLFSDKKTRENLWNVYTKYLTVLDEINRIDLSFQPITLTKSYRFICAEESQDYSRCQLRSLVQQQPVNKDNPSEQMHNLVFNIGDHQHLLGSESILPFIRTLFWELYGEGFRISQETLTASYRCPKRVIAFANAILQQKYESIGGSKVLNKNELTFVDSQEGKEGEIDWLANREELNALIARHEEDAQFVVITSTEFLVEARALFRTERVFTPGQYKGLEASHILLYRPLEQKGVREANRALGPDFSVKNQPELSKARNEHSSICHSSLFNQLFVATTRAQDSLTIYQPKIEEHSIRNSLHRFVCEHKNPIADKAPAVIKSSQEDWIKQANYLEQNGLKEQSRLIRTKWQAAPSAPAKPLKPKPEAGPSPARKNESLRVPARQKPKIQAPKKQGQPEAPINLMKELLKTPQTALIKIVQREDCYALLYLIPMCYISDTLPDRSFAEYLKTKEASRLKEDFLRVLVDLVTKYTHEDTHETYLDLLSGILHYRHEFNKTIMPLAWDLIQKFDKNTKEWSFIQGYKLSRSIQLKKLIEENDFNAVDNLRYLNALDFKFEHQRTIIQLLTCKPRPNIRLINKLVEAGANVDIADEEGNTPLHSAIHRFNNELAILFIMKSKNIDRQNNAGVTPLGLACGPGTYEVATRLIKKGANVNNRDKNGMSPLFLAVLHGNLQLTKTLLDASADCEMVNQHNNGDTLLHTALKFRKLAVVELLIPKCKNILNQRNHMGHAVIHTAAEYDRDSMIPLLAEQGALINQQTDQGNTAVYITAEEGHLKSLKELIRCGGDITIRANDGSTPLFAAIRKNQPSIVSYLLSLGDRFDLSQSWSCRCNTLMNYAKPESDTGNTNSIRQFIAQKGLSPDSADELLITPFELATLLEHHEIASLIKEKSKRPPLVSPGSNGFFSDSAHPDHDADDIKRNQGFNCPD